MYFWKYSSICFCGKRRFRAYMEVVRRDLEWREKQKIEAHISYMKG